MIDSHCHLTDPRLYDQIDMVLNRAQVAGVKQIVTIGTDPSDAAAAIGLCEIYPMLRCAIGIHPNESGNFDVDAVGQIHDLALHPAVVAIGEMGLDYYWDKVDRPRQRRVFEKQLELATRLNKPVIIHSREAVADTLEVLSAFPHVSCVFHCFTGSFHEATAIIEAGHYLGFTGAITFKKNDQLREVVRQTPADRILVETDGPYLSPEPVRNKKICEPAFVQHTLATVAAVRQLSLVDADVLTTTNTATFYRL